MIVVVMGVAGSGKTLIGRLLADELEWPFIDADDLHGPANVEKMRAGVPLTDADRDPWLLRLNGMLRDFAARGEHAVIACSALKERYRRQLALDAGDVRFVYLKGAFALMHERIQTRAGHYFGPELLRSQFDALEEPGGAITIDASQPPDVILREIRAGLSLPDA